MYKKFGRENNVALTKILLFSLFGIFTDIAISLFSYKFIVNFTESNFEQALDNETQREIQNAIENLKVEYTILIVAHRLSTVVDCDKIFVVDKGKIIASGSHKELLKKSDFYRSLYEKDLNV